MNPDDLWTQIQDLTNVYRVGMGLAPLKNPPEPEILDGREREYTDRDEDEPDRCRDNDDDYNDPRHGQAKNLNKLR